MHSDTHRNNGTAPAALPFIPPSSGSSGGRAPTGDNAQYRTLFRLLFTALELFDRCDDCETLIHAWQLFQYLAEVAEDCADEAWEAG